MTNDAGIADGIQAIAVFEGWECVAVGYFGSRGYGIEDETDWQVENKLWMDKMDITSVGRYYVKVSEDKFLEYDELNYYSNWNDMMRVVIFISTMQRSRFGFTIDPWGIEIIDYMTSAEKTIVRVQKENDETLADVYFQVILEFIKWYNAQPKSDENKL